MHPVVEEANHSMDLPDFNDSPGDLVAGLFNRLVLPDPQHSPAGRNEKPVVGFIARRVSTDFAVPIVTIGTGHPAMFGTSVPEATIHEHRDSYFFEDNVWPDSTCRELEDYVLAKTMPPAMQSAAKGKLRFGVRATIRLH